jgi:hypothetical protein
MGYLGEIRMFAEVVQSGYRLSVVRIPGTDNGELTTLNSPPDPNFQGAVLSTRDK